MLETECVHTYILTYLYVCMYVYMYACTLYLVLRIVAAVMYICTYLAILIYSYCMWENFKGIKFWQMLIFCGKIRIGRFTFLNFWMVKLNLAINPMIDLSNRFYRGTISLATFCICTFLITS